MEPAETQHKTKEKPGFFVRLREGAPDIIKNNAPRIVAGLKICSSITALLSKNRVFGAAGAGFIGAFSIIALFGGKKTEEEKEKLRNEEKARDNGKPKGRLSEYFRKLSQPRKYPIESGTSVAMLSSAFWTASGVLGKGGFSPGRLIGGALSFASDANIVFTKERIGEEKANPHKKGSIRHYLTELRNRPVLLSSMFNISSDISMVVGGAHEYFKQGKEINSLLVGIILLTANIFQAIFVDKNDYNIEAKADSKEPENANTPSHETAEKKPVLHLVEKKPEPKQQWGERVTQAPSSTTEYSLAA